MLNAHVVSAPRPVGLVPNIKQQDGRRNTARTRPLTKKNGKYRVLLLAGGPRDLAKDIRLKLARRGLYVKYHWESDKDHQFHRDIPTDVDFVITLKDFMGHSQEYAVVAQCKDRNMRWIRSGRKMINIEHNLTAHRLLKEYPLPEQYVATMQWGENLGKEPVAKEPEPEKIIREVARVVDFKAEVLPRATADLQAMLIKEITERDPQRASFVMPAPKAGIPSPQLAYMAAMLQRLCAEEMVQLMCSPSELTFNAAKSA